ncbi:hypothetical protein [Pseudomonas baetica]|uniref:hypothetical protein n=1 Tax=Pseudomonas baetica TaxID=674054 RepID=UPI002406AD50|nr:hypothetical protein [Pseudomonas baetica]MDF9778895.1 hypothetical protein [Pseudomonas baetica]
MASTLGMLVQLTASGREIPHEAAVSALRSVEYTIQKVGGILKVETQTAADIEERHAKLRTANLRVRELEAQLGQAQTPETTLLALRNLKEQLTRWWELEGFGHVSEVVFEAYGCRAKLSCHLYGDFPLVDSPTPLTDKERKVLWYQSLRDRGFELEISRGDTAIVDNDASRKALAVLIAKRFPSGTIVGIGNVGSRGSSSLTMRDVDVRITNLEDIAALPVQETRTA